MKHVVVVGGGFGGLAAAAELARAGIDVTVLEAHVYPGGCAGTFYHKGYRFDAGATLAGGFSPESPMSWVAERYEIDWEFLSSNLAMKVYLPDGEIISRWVDPLVWQKERISHFGAQAESFWQWQERSADRLWKLAMKLPPWPPQSLAQVGRLAKVGMGWLLEGIAQPKTINMTSIGLDATRSVASHLKNLSSNLRMFVDAQLLISAQTTSRHTNALYGSAALDLPRRGVVYVPGGMGSLALKMAAAIEREGGKVYFRHEVTGVYKNGNNRFIVETKRGNFSADEVIFNLPPKNIQSILAGDVRVNLTRFQTLPKDGWGAFMLYLGVDEKVFSEELNGDLSQSLHHQVIAGEPLGEGNSIFLSISPSWDKNRAPSGQRVITISTHTKLSPWWRLFEQDRDEYESRKVTYTDKILDLAETAIPGLRKAIRFHMSGTPVTFQRFTRRAQGWVGGFPQTNLFRTGGPMLANNVWMVGDSIFPGQSVPAVVLGGVRVAQMIIPKEPHR